MRYREFSKFLPFCLFESEESFMTVFIRINLQDYFYVRLLFDGFWKETLLEKRKANYGTHKNEKNMILDTVMERLQNVKPESACYFADGLGGCGKFSGVMSLNPDSSL